MHGTTVSRVWAGTCIQRQIVYIDKFNWENKYVGVMHGMLQCRLRYRVMVSEEMIPLEV